ncbi:hypothetical protein D1872_221050 [compost metagenome]
MLLKTPVQARTVLFFTGKDRQMMFYFIPCRIPFTGPDIGYGSFVPDKRLFLLIPTEGVRMVNVKQERAALFKPLIGPLECTDDILFFQ